MQRTIRGLALAGVALAGVLLVTPAEAQQPRRTRGSINQMEVYSGGTRTVRYFGSNLSPGEEATLREAERLENEQAYVRELQDLKRRYVSDETKLEARRYVYQRRMYDAYPVGQWWWGGGLEGLGGVAALGLRGGFYAGYYPWMPATTVLGGAYPYGGPGLLMETSGTGYGGVIKEAMAQVLAQQSTPEYAASIDRSYEQVVLRASTSPTLRVAFGVPALQAVRSEMQNNYRAIEGPASTGAVTLTMRGGDRISATSTREEGDWVVLYQDGRVKSKVRQSEVLRVDYGGTGGISGAAGKPDAPPKRRP